MSITNETLRGVGNDICTTMLGFDLVVDDGEMWGGGTVFRTGCISITGDEKYALFIDSAERLIQKLAADMFDTFEDHLNNEEIEDALGELCNIAGGMVQHELNGSFQLGLPVVSKERNRSLTIPDGMIVADIKATCGNMPLRLTFLRLGRQR